MGRFFGPGTLALAGMASGGANALTHALSSAQSYVQQDALQQARDEMDMKRLALQEKYAGEREQRGYTHAETLQKGTQDFTKGENAANRTHAETLHGQTEAGANARTDRTIAGQLESNKVGHELANKGQAATQESLDARQLLEIEKDIKVARISATKSLEKKLDPAIDAQIKAEMKMLDVYGDQLKGNMDPSAIPEIQKKLDLTKQNIARLVGVEPPPKVSTQIQGDKWSGMLSPKDANAATTTPTPGAVAKPTENFTVERNRPVMPRGGRPDPANVAKIDKGQLDYDVQEALAELNNAKIHGNKARVAHLQALYDDLVNKQSGTLSRGGR